jgi:hypothetical protein
MTIEKPKIKSSYQNLLDELSELRLAIAPCDDSFDVTCRLRFASTDVELHGRSYTVGISEARLQLSLEGCETAIGYDYGAAELASGSEERSSSNQSQVGGQAGGSISLDGLAIPSASVKAAAEAAFTHAISMKRELLPMTALTNNAWRVRDVFSKSGGAPLEGSAMEGQRLCRLQRKEGGNRLNVSAELQVKRRAISVNPSKGDKRGKLFSLSRNKDAVVAKVLEKAIRREASTMSRNTPDDTIVASTAELTEE